MVESLLVLTVILLLSLGYHGGLSSYVAHTRKTYPTFSFDYAVCAEGVKMWQLGKLIQTQIYLHVLKLSYLPEV